MKKRDVAAMIDHTILKPEATAADVARIVEEGAAAGTFSVCVSPSMLPLDVPEGLKVACVVGSPPVLLNRRSRRSRPLRPSPTELMRSTWSSTSSWSRTPDCTS